MTQIAATSTSIEGAETAQRDEPASSDDADPCSPMVTPEDDEEDQCRLVVDVIPPDPDDPLRDPPPVDCGSIQQHLRAIADLVGLAQGEIVVRIVTDAEMSDLHREFCNDPSTTDVLTFDTDEDADGGRPTADGASGMTGKSPGDLARRANPRGRTHIEVSLAVCIDEARRQAAARRHGPNEELLLYAVHGLLHCLGHDDHRPDSYEVMHAVEDELLNRLGVGAVFGRTERDASEEEPP